MVINIRVACSSMAKLTGHNTFNPIEKDVADLLRYNKYIPREKKDSKVEEILDTCDDLKIKMIKRKLKVEVPCTNKELADIIIDKYIGECMDKDMSEDEANNKLEAAMGEDEFIKEELEKSLTKDMIIRRGILKEQSNLDKVENIKNCFIGCRNVSVDSNIAYIDPDSEFQIELRGKVDGKIQDDGTIIESKNRHRKLFGCIPDYEMVQMECYMFLTDCGKGILAEHHNGKENLIPYEHDPTFWNKCLESAGQYIRDHVLDKMKGK